MLAEYKASPLFNQNYHAVANIVVNQGGSHSGKTYAILLALFCIASDNKKLVITVVGQDIPNLKAGALRDALNIYSDSELFKSRIRAYNKSDRIFEFHNGTIMEFKKLW